MEKSKLLILTGPQGSGNHLWAKILSRHPFVYGWKMKKYWEGHHLEPFSHWWDDPSKIEDTQTKYNFTSISCPYFRDNKPCIPKYEEFISKLDTYKPRQFILDNLSVRKCSEILTTLISNI